MPGIKLPHATKLFDILKMTHDPKDYGYWNKTKRLRLRANSKQIACWELAIDLLPKVELESRRLLWSRAKKHSWVSLARMFGCHRVTIKRKYLKAILDLEFNLDKSMIDKIDKI